MDQLKKMWGALSLFQRLSIGVVVLAAGGAILWLSSWRHESNFKPLFRGMAGEDAAEALQKLKENNVEFRLEDEGATILVPAEKLAETRLILAREGLPKTGRIGFELFDKTNFATTDFAEQVNYRRALEGELARTISTLAEIDRARVHLTFAKDSVFVESRQPAKASVLLNLRRTASLSPVNVAAIAHLVASSVEGLSPQQVTIVDSHGELLNKPRGNNPLAASDTQLDYQMTMEHELANKLNQTLDPVLGPGNYRTGVSVECDFSGVEESEEVLDPTKSVMVSSQRTDESAPGRNSAGIPGTASNLPNPPAPTVAAAAPNTTRRSESMSYQTSRLVRHVDHPRGGVKRITVAVLLDQGMRWERKGATMTRTFIPPTPEKINVIRDMITNVAGINTARGDQVTVESLPFDGTLREDPPTAVNSADKNVSPRLPGWSDRLRDIRMIAGAGAIFGAVCFLLWRASRRRRAKVLTQMQVPALSEGAGAVAGHEMDMALSSPQSAVSEEQQLIDSLRGPMLSSPSKTDALTRYLRQEVKKDPQAATQILRTWLLEEEH